jgi:hypothetical protein
MRRATTIAAVVLAALAIAACGESPEDEARDDGERIGETLRALFDSEDLADAQAAMNDLRAAVDEVADETSDAVQDQIDTQRSTIEDAVEAAQSADIDAVKGAVQQLRAQADAFRSGSDSVANEFWRGFEEGYDGDS